MKAKNFATSIATTLIVTAVASAWAVTSPLSASCAWAAAGDQIALAPAETAAFVSELNEVRASKGLNALVVSDNLTSVAVDWADHMAGQEALAHRANLAAGVTVDWRLLGENVGRAPSVGEMMRAFINSPTHYKNLVEGSFTHIGVGTVRTPDGLLYSAHEFAAVKPAAAPAPAPAPAPAKVVAKQAAPVGIVAAPAPSTTTTSTTVAPVVAVEHSVPAEVETSVESASAGATDKPRTGC